MERKFLLALVGAMSLVIILGGVYVGCERRRHAAAEVELKNRLVELQTTIEVKKGLYEHATQEISDLRVVVRDSSSVAKSLVDEVERGNERLLVATKAAAFWKKAYEGEAQASETSVGAVPSGCGSVRTRVDFVRDFGYIRASGHTLTNPAEAHVKVEQMRPLVLTLALAQAPDGAWKTYVTSSEENVGIDVRLSAVNPRVIAENWYERLVVRETVAFGSGLAGSFSLAYGWGKFDVGPTVMFSLDGSDVGRYYGLSVGWRPFKHVR